MCEYQPNLIAWLDGELSPVEAAAAARHVESCEPCRAQFASFREASQNFQHYCDAVLAANSKPKFPRWVPALTAAALVAAATLFLIFPRKHAATSRPVQAPILATTAASAPTPTPAPVLTPAPALAPRKATPHARRANPANASSAAAWRPTETAVEIAIPADAMFAPGAVPPGMKFFAEMSIAPDGSVRQVRLRQ
jgi:anti-sigma factor RsiW